jgi:hypothetical protein
MLPREGNSFGLFVRAMGVPPTQSRNIPRSIRQMRAASVRNSRERQKAAGLRLTLMALLARSLSSLVEKSVRQLIDTDMARILPHQ